MVEILVGGRSADARSHRSRIPESGAGILRAQDAGGTSTHHQFVP
jgi:hypothetical protein